METIPTVAEAPAPSARLGFNEALGRTWNLYRRSWKRLTLLIILSVACVAVLVVGTGLLAQGFKAGFAGGVSAKGASPLILLVAMAAGMIILQSWFWTAYLRIIDHPTLSVRQSLNEGRRFVWPFLWTSALSSLVMLGGSLLIVPAIIWSVAFSLLGWVTVIEGRKGLDALVRARQLMVGDGWWLFGMQLAAGLIVTGLSYVGQWMIDVAVQNDAAWAALNIALYIVQTLLITPLFTVFLYVLYKDLLARKEGRLAALPDTRRHFLWALFAMFVGAVAAAFLGFLKWAIEK